MERKLMTGNEAAAWGMRLSQADYVPAFPITPQTEIIEAISSWIDRGEISCRMVDIESEHSMITAAGTAAATGVRVFTATSSQGLLYGMEMLYTVAGWRVPFVLVNVSRGVAAPLTLESDHNDVLAARDSGFLQFHCATCQEVLDGVLLAYRLGEDPRVRLPVIVNLDGFHLSFTREPVEIPDLDAVREFLPPYDPRQIHFRAGSPRSQAVAVLGGTAYSYFRYETHLAAEHSLEVYEEVAREFGERFGRSYEAVETYRCDDAEFAFVMIGAFATKAKAVVDGLREDGWRIGLVRPRLVRPFPQRALVEALAGRRGVAVIDQNLSPGKGGILHGEVMAALYHAGAHIPAVASFVGGLGGRDIQTEEFVQMAETLREAASAGTNPPPRLLFTSQEMEQIRELQAVAMGNANGAAAHRPAFAPDPGAAPTGRSAGGKTVYKSMKNLPAEHLLAAGTALCSGCGGMEVIKLFHDILGPNTVFVNAAGCMTMLAIYPFTPFRGSWIYTAMPSAPAGAQGIRDALTLLIESGRIPASEDLHVVVLTGDGAANGIGMSAASGALDRKLDFYYLCYDNEGYGNTGHQTSGATPFGARTATNHGEVGVRGEKKDLFSIWAAHDPAYLATVSGDEPVDLARKLEKAMTLQGPKLFIALAPCPTGWHFDPRDTVRIGKLAVKTGIWPLKEYADGQVRHTRPPAAPGKRPPVEDYLVLQGRFAHLFKPVPKQDAIGTIQGRVDAYWEAIA